MHRELTIRVVSLVFSLLYVCSGQVKAEEVMIDNLTTPPIYDNASEPLHYGQSFVSDGRSVIGIDFFQGVTTAAPNCISNQATLVLFELTGSGITGRPGAIGSVKIDGTALPCGDGTPASVNFDVPVPTQDGARYVFIIFSTTKWDFGLTGSISTYAEGGQAVFIGDLDGFNEIDVGERDSAFRVRVIPSWAAVDHEEFVQIADINGDSIQDYAILSRLNAQLFLMTINGRTGARIKRVLITSDLGGRESFGIHLVGSNLNILTSHPWKGGTIEVRHPSTLAFKKRIAVPWSAP